MSGLKEGVAEIPPHPEQNKSNAAEHTKHLAQEMTFTFGHYKTPGAKCATFIRVRECITNEQCRSRVFLV